MPILLVIIYLSFISLGLPDSLLGSAWPSMHLDLNSSLSFAGIIFFTINLGTVISLLAMPFGLAAGAVDCALNNYVALNYQSKHMNYLHSFWGLGAAGGPLILALYLGQQQGWRLGYATVAIIQFLLMILIFATLSKWKTSTASLLDDKQKFEFVSNKHALQIKGVKLHLFIMFSYCAFESCVGLWAASFLIHQREFTLANAAFWVSMYYIGITIGRFFSGYLTQYLNETTLVRIGLLFIFMGLVLFFIPFMPIFSQLSLVLIGLGCAPIYPNIIHLTPTRFGKAASQTIVGMSMACAYLGTTTIAPLFGFVASAYSLFLLPIVLLILAVLVLMMSERLNQLKS